jgi:hypothetical protein
MRRLSLLVAAAAAVATSAVGCSTFCDGCADFPAPAYSHPGIGMTGSYTGRPLTTDIPSGPTSGFPAASETPANAPAPPPATDLPPAETR